jgi:serine protease Do
MKTSTFLPAKKMFSRIALAAISASIALPFATPSGAFAQPVSPSAPLVTGLPDFTDLVDKTGPAVVNIRTTQKVQQQSQDFEGFPFGDDLFRQFGFPMPPRQQQQPRNNRKAQPDQEVPRGVGSGFIISGDGFVLTNAHVVEGASEIYVRLTDKREFKAKLIGSDKRTDVAVLKIEGSKLPRLAIGDSNKVRVGEWVIAIGSPFDLDNTVTAGIISAKARDTGDYLPLIQTDVAVNPGNSGGPLLNLRGEVVGINSQIYSRSGGYMGISFAIPIDEAMRVVDQLRSTGKVSRGRIGVAIGDITKDAAESIGLAKAQGALVTNVQAGTPAEKGGIKDGDVILKFNGTAIERSSDLPRLVGATKPGSKATVTVWRNGAQRDFTLTIGESEPDNKVASKADKPSKQDSATNPVGIYVADLSAAQKADKLTGVVIERVDGVAETVDLRPGDVITSINQIEIKDAKQFAAVTAKLDLKKPIPVFRVRGGATQIVVIKPQ